MTTRTTRRPGLTLLEMSAVMVVLTVVMLVGTALIVAALGSNRALLAADQRATGRTTLAEQFRADVAEADSTPENAGPFAAGPGTLILGRPGGTRVVYRPGADGRLERIELSGDRQTVRPIPLAGAKAEFRRTEGNRPLVTLALTETPRTGPPRRTDVSAALGGDLR